LFSLTHIDGDGHINFEEFLNGISLMCETGDFKEKVQFSFQVYDFDGDGFISNITKQNITPSNLGIR